MDVADVVSAGDRLRVAVHILRFPIAVLLLPGTNGENFADRRTYFKPVLSSGNQIIYGNTSRCGRTVNAFACKANVWGFDSTRRRKKENENMDLYSTLTRKVEPLTTLHPDRVYFFVCGPTVYDYSHIGHARTYVVFDVFVKYLQFTGKEVFYLQNITDVDDKIINRARQENISQSELARKFEREYLADMHALGIDAVSYYARATTHIPEIIDQVGRLLKKGVAYVTENGVYFNIDTFGRNGELSGQGGNRKSRVIDESKFNPEDFALWKFGEYGEYTWDSPWGRGGPAGISRIPPSPRNISVSSTISMAGAST